MGLKGKPVKVTRDGLKAVLEGGVGFDKDNDGENSAEVDVKMSVDAKELVVELFKDDFPEWLAKLLGMNQEQVVVAQSNIQQAHQEMV